MRKRVIDIETTSLSQYKGVIFSYCIGGYNGEVGVYRLDTIKRKKNLIKLQEFFEETSTAKIAHNFHFELKWFRLHGINIPEETVWEDTMIMSQLLRNDAPSHALHNLCYTLCGYPKIIDEEIERMNLYRPTRFVFSCHIG